MLASQFLLYFPEPLPGLAQQAIKHLVRENENPFQRVPTVGVREEGEKDSWSTICLCSGLFHPISRNLTIPRIHLHPYETPFKPPGHDGGRA
jgi:hypothetical protein